MRPQAEQSGGMGPTEQHYLKITPQVNPSEAGIVYYNSLHLQTF